MTPTPTEDNCTDAILLDYWATVPGDSFAEKHAYLDSYAPSTHPVAVFRGRYAMWLNTITPPRYLPKPPPAVPHLPRPPRPTSGDWVRATDLLRKPSREGRGRWAEHRYERGTGTEGDA